jgi:hypothetical protein
MIAFDLFCSNGHKFECWFKDSASCEEQIASRTVSCPLCNDHQIERAFSPFMIKRDGRKKNSIPSTFNRRWLITDYIDKHFEDVRTGFYKEALKSIRVRQKKYKGNRPTEEEVILKEEGVAFLRSLSSKGSELKRFLKKSVGQGFSLALWLRFKIDFLILSSLKRRCGLSFPP